MNESKIDELKQLDKHLETILMRLNASISTTSNEIDLQIVLYSRRLLNASLKIFPDSIELISHIARCFLELEVIVKWLKQDLNNYKIYCADAEYSNLGLMRPQKELAKLIDTSAGNSKYSIELEAQIEKMKKNVEVKGFDEYKESIKLLWNTKELANKLDKNLGAVVAVDFDFYSKMSHPTPWLIMTPPHEEKFIREKALRGIRNSVVTILNTLDNSLRLPEL